MLGDDIIDAVPCMKQMIDVFERHAGPVIAVQQVPRQDISSYGVIDGEPEGPSGRVYRIRDLVEKPAADEAPERPRHHRTLHPDAGHLRRAGRHPARRRRRIQLTNGLRALKERRALYGYRFEACARRREQARLPEGDRRVRAQAEDLGTPFRAYLKSLKL